MRLPVHPSVLARPSPSPSGISRVISSFPPDRCWGWRLPVNGDTQYRNSMFDTFSAGSALARAHSPPGDEYESIDSRTSLGAQSGIPLLLDAAELPDGEGGGP